MTSPSKPSMSAALSAAGLDAQGPVAYLCTEYAIEPSLRIYTGELGLRAADYLASASALALPVIALGLFFRSALVTEEVGDDGYARQAEVRNDPDSLGLGLERVLAADGAPLSVTITLSGRQLEVGAWELGVGRVRLILLDTELEANAEADRALTRRLEPMGGPTRARQDALLRCGAEQMLRAMGITPRVFHLEGPRQSKIARSLSELDDAAAEHIQDGVHLPSWTSADVVATLEIEGDPIGGRDFVERVDQVKTRALWNLRARARERMVGLLHARGLPAGDSDALWVGCAGRFGAGMRADLLMADLARLERLLDDPINPVRMVFAGEADPDDALAQAQLAKIIELSGDARFGSRIVFVPDLSLELAHALVEGVDLWLSTPTRGRGTRGTWGMRAAANGALNVSVPDGWWPVDAAEDMGWTIGGAREFDDQAAQDAFDMRMLYQLVEKDIVPMFYDWNNEGIPLRWVERIRASMRSIPVEFDSDRMVRDYLRRVYEPLVRAGS